MLPARLLTLDGSLPAIIENLSRNGARIVVGGKLEQGAVGVLSWENGEAFVQVNWSRAGRSGLQFDMPLDDKALIQARWLNENQAELERSRCVDYARQFVDGQQR